MPDQKKPSRSKAAAATDENTAELRKLVHDLNNAIAPITLYAGILKSIVTDKKAAEMLDNVELSAKKVADIAEKLQDLGHRQTKA